MLRDSVGVYVFVVVIAAVLWCAVLLHATLDPSSESAGRQQSVWSGELALRLTYVGPQDHPIPGLVLLGSSASGASSGAHEAELPVQHANDALVGSVTVPTNQTSIDHLVADMSGLAAQSMAKGPDDAKIAVTLVPLAFPDSIREWYMDRRATRLLLGALRTRLAEDSTALAAVTAFSASMGYRRLP